MRADELKGRAVVTLMDAAKIGRVDDVLFDAAYRNVLGFRVKAGALRHTEALPRAGVSAIGADAITVADQSAVNSEDRFAELAGALTLDSAQHTKVVTEGGDLLGVVHAVELDDTAEHVLAYTLDAPLLDRMRGRAPQIRAEDVVRIGAGGIMIVPNSVGEQLHSTGA
jgi:uncharacterized protein YrrD